MLGRALAQCPDPELEKVSCVYLNLLIVCEFHSSEVIAAQELQRRAWTELQGICELTRVVPGFLYMWVFLGRGFITFIRFIKHSRSKGVLEPRLLQVQKKLSMAWPWLSAGGKAFPAQSRWVLCVGAFVFKSAF